MIKTILGTGRRAEQLRCGRLRDCTHRGQAVCGASRSSFMSGSERARRRSIRSMPWSSLSRRCHAADAEPFGRGGEAPVGRCRAPRPRLLRPMAESRCSSHPCRMRDDVGELQLRSTGTRRSVSLPVDATTISSSWRARPSSNGLLGRLSSKPCCARPAARSSWPPGSDET